MKALDVFTPAAIAAYWTENQSNRIPYIGSGFFPSAQKRGLDLSWFRGSNGLAVSLMPSAFDAKATFRDRPGFSKTETEMPFFREGFKLKERDRQELLRVADSKDPYAAPIIARLFDDAANLIESADVVAERERMQLLFPEDGNVGINFTANGVAYTYNYDASGSWKASNYFALTGNARWSQPSTSDPFADLKTAKDAVADKTGANIAFAVMNSYTFGLLSQSTAVKNRFLTKNGMNVGYISDADVKKLVKDDLELTVVVYDKKYADESGVAAKYVPNGYVSLLPESPVGKTWYGTTPEEADLMGNPAAKVSIVNTGVAITQITDPHPVNLNTFASEIVLPSYEGMDSVAVLKVIGNA